MSIPLPLLVVSALTLAATLPALGQPTNNPITAHYPGEYAWTDEISWSEVFSVLDYGAVADGNFIGDGVGVTDNLPAFDAAIQAAFSNGGGVVFVPAGVYYLSNHLYLQDGVVLRGETPTETDAQSDSFRPASRLEFPRYVFDPTANGGTGNPASEAFRFIYSTNGGSDSNLGLVWLDINRAGISISTTSGNARNRIVFGTRTNNVAAPQPWTIPASFQHPWQIHSMRFTDNINIYARENVLVANNRCNDKHYRRDMTGNGEYLGDPSYVPAVGEETDCFRMPGYIVKDNYSILGRKDALVTLDGTQAIFSYTNHYGITARGSTGGGNALTPYQDPDLFRKSITIRDNWVYTTMRVGYHTSGSGLHIKNNVKKDLPNKSWWMDTNGDFIVRNDQTLENRGIDFSGTDILIEDNDLQVHRHSLSTGRYGSVDGEAILLQECCGGTIMQNLTIRDNTANAYIGLFKINYLREVEITGNTLTGPGYIMVQANTNYGIFPLFDVLVEGNTITGGGGIQVQGRTGGGKHIIRNNTGNGGRLRINDDDLGTPGNKIATLTNNTGFHPDVIVEEVLGVRDYPKARVLPIADAERLEGGDIIDVTVVVDGTFLNPDPTSLAELPAPDHLLVQLYDNRTLIAEFTMPTTQNAEEVRYEYTHTMTPTLGWHQFSARVAPSTTFAYRNLTGGSFTAGNRIQFDGGSTSLVTEVTENGTEGTIRAFLLGLGASVKGDGAAVTTVGGGASAEVDDLPISGYSRNYGTEWFTVTEIETATVIQVGEPVQVPFGGTPWAIPGKIEAEDYDIGSQGTAYNDNDSGNNGGNYRTEGVDIETTGDSGSGFNVGWTNPGEWLEYTTQVESRGLYTLDIRVATPQGGRSLRVLVDEVDVTGLVDIPTTGAWQSWTTVSVPEILLEAGTRTIRLQMTTGGININHFRFTTEALLPDLPELPELRVSMEAGQLVVRFDTEVGVSYQLETAVDSLDFAPHATAVGDGTEATMEISLPEGSPTSRLFVRLSLAE